MNARNYLSIIELVFRSENEPKLDTKVPILLFRKSSHSRCEKYRKTKNLHGFARIPKKDENLEKNR